MQKSKISRPSQTKCHPSRKMRALQFQGKDSLKMTEVPMPMVTDPTDVVVKVTATSVGGSDINVYHNMIPGMNKGDVVGRECVGVVEEVGTEVKRVKKGDRVVISPVIACGQCDNCSRNEWCCCETTNPTTTTPETQKTTTSTTTTSTPTCNIGSLMGCSRSVGGFDGCHAEYVRVPFADVNVFPIPNDISDKEALLVADVASTGLHANVLADVKAGDRVVVIGCGAVGLMTQMWAKQRGASMIVAIDSDQQRLTWAKERLGSMPLNSREEDILEAVASLIPGGPDKVIDCVGCSQSSEGFLQKLQMALKMQTDSPNIVNLAIKMVRKNGRITLIGNYVGTCNNFNIGGLMEKHLTINGGQVMPQTYQKEVMDAISSKKINPSMLITHSLPLSKLDEAYRMFDKHEGGMLKPLIVPDELYRGENVMKSTVSK